jgi:hypothetical protein
MNAASIDIGATPRGTPLMNLNVTMLHMFGIPLEKFGDSTGEISLRAA